MTRWGIILGVLLLITTGLGICSATIPDNLSSFDPETFSLSEKDAPDAIASFRADIDAMDDSGMISGTGSVTDEIRLTDESGDVTVSHLQIIGTDETVWHYQFQNQSTGNIATAVAIEVANAERLTVSSMACRNDGDIVRSIVDGLGSPEGKKITGNVLLKSGFSTDLDVGYPYPESSSLADSLSGTRIRILDTAESDAQISYGSLTGDEIALSLPVQIGDKTSDDLLDPISPSPEQMTPEEVTGYLSNSIRNNSPGLVQGSGETDKTFALSRMDLSDGVLTGRYGSAYVLPDETFTYQYAPDLEATSCSFDTETQKGEYSEFSSHQIRGEEISDMWYLGTGRYSDEESHLAARYDFSSGTEGSRLIGYQSGENRFLYDHQETRSAPGNPVQGSNLFSGEDILTTRDQTLSFSGNYDITSPYVIRQPALLYNGKVNIVGYLEIGDETSKKPVSLKGYIQYQGSAGQNPASSMQSLFYADAPRGTSMNWGTQASQEGAEPVITTGSSTGGSRFIRQKAYADHSSLIAS